MADLSGAAPGTSRADYRRLADFGDYAQAQALVDRLSDHGFPVANVRIIGTGIHSVEQVTGRLTNGRAAWNGTAGGAWFGLLIGLLFSLFVPGFFWLTMVLTSVVIGAVFGAAFGFLAHWSTRGARDFSSVSAMTADRYEVQVAAQHLDEAGQLANGG